MTEAVLLTGTEVISVILKVSSNELQLCLEILCSSNQNNLT